MSLSRCAAIVLAGVLVAGCSSGDDEPAEDRSTTASASPSAAAEPVTTVVRQGELSGVLDADGRLKVRRDVAARVDTWLDAGWVDADYPTGSPADFRGAFVAFTPKATRLAKRDPRLVNTRLGGRIDGVTVTERRVVVDMLAVKGTAFGATARVLLRFDTSGEAERRVVLDARLQLTRSGPKAPWQIFGYDVRTRTTPTRSGEGDR